MKRHLALALLVLGLVGCGDTATTLSREYRNYNNEFIDALMMTTNESRAKIAKEKVIETYEARIQALDKRVDVWEQNKEKEEVALDTLTAESVALLFSENKRNQERHALEKARLKKLIERLTAENPGVNPAEQWPNLNDLANGARADIVLNQLKTGGRLAVLMQKFGGWKLKQETLAKAEVFKEKVERFDKR
jgi:hypothetical protein